MRIDQLSLRAFGKFTDHTVDLSAGNHGLHIVFGNNEAGKSTSLRAITDWLFGFPRSTNDDFIHPYKNMRVGGTLRNLQGETLSVLRRKATSNSLRDLEDREVVSEVTLASYLGNIDRDRFCNMFGIDQSRLRQGGEALVQNRGQLGESLFAGASGIHQLQAIRKSLDAESAALFVSRSNGGELGKSVESYQKMSKSLKDEIVTASVWNALQNALEEAIRQKQEFEEQIRQLTVNVSRRQRIKENLQAVSTWRSLNDQWEIYKDVVVLDDNFGPTVTQLINRLNHLHIEIRNSQDILKVAEGKLEGLAMPQGLQQHSDRLETLRTDEGTYRANRKRLPNLQEELTGLVAEQQQIYESLGKSASDLPLDLLRSACSRETSVSHLIQQKGTLDQSLIKARSLCETKKLDLDSVVKSLAEQKVAPNLAGLKVTAKRIGKENPASRLSDLNEQIAAAEIDLKTLLLRVVPDGRSTQSLKQPQMLSRFDIEQFEGEERELRSDGKQIDEAIQNEQLQLKQFQTNLLLLESDATIPTLDELRDIREKREGAWQLVKERWIKETSSEAIEKEFLERLSLDGPIESVFETLVERADQVSDALRDDATRVAEKISLQRSLALCQSRIESHQNRLELCVAKNREWKVRWDKAWSDVDITPKSPSEMLEWVRLKDQLIERDDQLQTLKEKRQQIEETAIRFQTELSSSLLASEFRIPEGSIGLSELLSLAEDYCGEQVLAEKTVADLHKRQKTIEDAIRQADFEILSATTGLQEWQEQWSNDMKLLGIPGDTSCYDANRILGLYGDLRTKRERQSQVEREISTTEREGNEFLSRLSDLLAEFHLETSVLDDGKSAGIAISQMEQLANADRYITNERQNLQKEIEKAKAEIANQNHEHSAIEDQIASLLKLAQRESADQLPLAAEDSRWKKKLQTQITEHRTLLSSQAPGGNVEAFVEEVLEASKDIDSLQPEIERLRREIQELETKLDAVRAQYHESDVKLKDLRQRDTSHQTSLECESLVSRIEEQLRDLLVTRLCSRALSEGIEQFREQNQAPILRNASHFFREMTVERFEELRVDWDDDQPVIVAAPSAGGANLRVEQMSDGTRDQLYLALRLASIQEWLEKHPPIPFIVDDILIHFDDERAMATLKSLASLSNRTQIVFFTHHAHLIDLASDSVPSSQLLVHRL